MSAHDKDEKDILKQLTRIANALDKIDRKMPSNTFNQRSDTDFGIKLGVNVTNGKDCRYYSDGKEENIIRQNENDEQGGLNYE